MPASNARRARRAQLNARPLAERVANLDFHTPHLVSLAMAGADEDSARAHSHLLKNMDPAMHAAVDLLLEVAHESAQDPELKGELAAYQALPDKKARDWVAGRGFPLVHRLAVSHANSVLAPHGGSFLSFFKSVGHKIAGAAKTVAHGVEDAGKFAFKGAKKAVGLAGDVVKGVTGVAGAAAQNLAPVAQVAAQVAPLAAMAL